MVKVDRPYVQVFKDRHGRERIYYRRAGEKRVTLRGPLGGPEFEVDYRAALAAGKAGELTLPAPASPHTYKWLCLQYMQSSEFMQTALSTQSVRRGILESTWTEPIAPGSAVRIGDCPLDRFSPKIVRVLRDRKKATPHAANNRLKVVGYVLKWGVENEYLPSNPVRDVAHLKAPTDGHHTWTADEIAKFEAHWPIGSKPRLAFALLRYLGVRRSDVVRLGRQHVRNGVLCFTTKKCPVDLALPIPPALQAVLDASETGALTYLLTGPGKGFTTAGFGGWFRDQCDAADLPHCSAHGLRKAAATALADAGATPHQLMSWFGWRSLKQAELYTRAADQRRLAASVVPLIAKGNS